ncbi:MAG: hypothetical protein ACTSV2_05400, partial [Candidatus Thorarchaeota archaeon]
MVGIVGCISKKELAEIENVIDIMSSRLVHRGEHIHSRTVNLNPEDVSGFHIALKILSHHHGDPFIETKGNIGVVDSLTQLAKVEGSAKHVLEQLMENGSFKLITVPNDLSIANLFAITEAGVYIIRSIDGQRMLYLAKSD